MDICRSKKLRTLFSFDNLEEQKVFIQKKWNTLTWRIICECFIFNPHFLSAMGFVKKQTKDYQNAKIIYKRIFNVMSNQLTRENHVLTFLFFNRYIKGTLLPLYLRAESFDVLKEAISEVPIHICTNDIGKVCKLLPDASCDYISMSNVADHVSPKIFANYIQEAARILRRGGVLCWKYWSSNHTLPSEISEEFVHNLKAEKEIALSEVFFSSHVLEKT